MAPQIPEKLAFEFFEKFARFESAMKQVGFCARGQYNIAKPDWGKFDRELASRIVPIDGSALWNAMKYFLDHPPEIQFYDHGRAVFRPSALRGATDGAKVFCALRRVRNNLFHGGKHTDHSPEDRDATLLRHGIRVIEAASQLEINLDSAYSGRA